MNHKKIGWRCGWLGILVMCAVHASSPTSTSYVDAKIATLQAEINQILNSNR